MLMQYKTDEQKAWGLRNDPEYFAATALKVPAWGMKGVRGIVPFNYTYLQRRVMKEILFQMETRGEVDLIIVKPRKMRCTTVLNGWEYQRVLFEEALNVLNIAHSAPVAEEIFDRHIKTFHKFTPDYLRRVDKSNNKRELAFDDNLCKIIVAIAGSNASRGTAASILHLTESGWYNAFQVADVQRAVFPAVERGPGTARIDESTSAGNGTWQHRRALAAKNGEGINRLLFIGCFEVPEYRMTPPPGWEPTADERAIQQEFEIDLEQLYWRHVLLKDQFDGQEMLFNQEYPPTFDLAFQASGDKFFNAVKLLRAKLAKLQRDQYAVPIMGIDPAGSGDRTIIVIRQGRTVIHWESHRNMTAPTLIGIIRRLKQQWGTHNEFIDMGYGHGTYDLGRSMGMYSLIGVFPGAPADRKNLYANKRSEMGFDCKRWLEEGEDGGMVSIPDDQEFYDDLASVPGERVQVGTGKLILPPKAEIKKELGKSPDIFDALTYTFAYPELSNTSVLHLPYQQTEPQSLFDTERVFKAFDRSGSLNNTMSDSTLGLRVSDWTRSTEDMPAEDE
jgi:hypothetical protein